MSVEGVDYRREFRQILAQYFDLDGLRILAIDLGIDWDELSGETKTMKAQSLIAYLAQRGRLEDLVTLGRKERPYVEWPEVPSPEKQKAFEASRDQGDVIGGDQVGGDKITVRDVHGIAVIGAGATVNVQLPDGGERPVPMQMPARAEKFTGREAELEGLIDGLWPGEVVTLWGPGGIGKTALAAEAIWRLDEVGALGERFPDGLVWHGFYGQPEVDIALEQIARSFGEEPRPTSMEGARRALAGRKALIVLDGAEATDHLPTALEIRGGNGVLISTRDKRGARGQRVDVPGMLEDEAVELLQKWGGDFASDKVAGREICFLCGYLPLAVRLVGRYLEEQEERASSYLEWLRFHLEALDQGERQDQSVTKLLERSVRQVSGNAQNVLGVLGFLALAPFSRSLIDLVLGIEDNEARPAFAELVNYGLLNRIGNGYEAGHALIHRFARRRMVAPVGTLERLAEIYTVVAREWGQEGPEGYAKLDWERPHILTIMDRLRDDGAWAEVLALAYPFNGYLEIQGHWTERLLVCDAGLAAARKLENKLHEGSWLDNLGIAYSDLGQVEKAIEYHEQALGVAMERDDKRGEGAHLGNMGNAYSALGQVEKAIEYYEQALAIARITGNRKDESTSLGNLGLAYREIGKVDLGIDYHKQALAISREIGDRRGESAGLGNLGIAYNDFGQMEWAIDYHKQALVMMREIGDLRGESAQLGNLGITYAALGEVKLAIEYHKQALAISREIGNKRGEIAQLGNLGNAYGTLGEVKLAIEYHEQALVKSQEIGDKRGEGNQLGSLGIAYSSLRQFERAIDCYKQALVISREMGDLRGEGIHMGNLGIAYGILGQNERAIEYFEHALVISRKIRDRQGKGVRLGNLGTAYGALGQEERAIDYLEQARVISRETGDRGAEGAHLANLGTAYRDLGHVEQARSCLQQALEIFKEIKSPNAEKVRRQLRKLESK